MLIKDEREKQIVLRYRKDQEIVRQKEERIKNCSHKKRVYTGHSHNDDAYECCECGHIEWR